MKRLVTSFAAALLCTTVTGASEAKPHQSSASDTFVKTMTSPRNDHIGGLLDTRTNHILSFTFPSCLKNGHEIYSHMQMKMTLTGLPPSPEEQEPAIAIITEFGDKMADIFAPYAAQIKNSDDVARALKTARETKSIPPNSPIHAFFIREIIPRYGGLENQLRKAYPHNKVSGAYLTYKKPESFSITPKPTERCQVMLHQPNQGMAGGPQ